MLRIGDHRQFWSGLMFLIIGVVALVKLPKHVGTATAMGPGYFPMLLGLCLILFGGISIIQAIRSTEQIAVGRLPLVPLAFIVGCVLCFAALVNDAGLALSLACLVLGSCYRRIRNRPLEVAAIYLILLGMTWVIFIYAIQLPITLF